MGIFLNKKIRCQNRAVPVFVKTNRRSRRLRITVYRDGRVAVSAPAGYSQEAIWSFVNHKAKWIAEKIEHFSRLPVLRIKTGKGDYKKFRAQAFDLAQKKVTEFNAVYGFRVNRVFIKNQKTRWGSCSKKGNLNFNFRIVFLPEALLDYLAVHELCHLAEFNHSARFWAQVARTIPDFKERKRSLAREGFSIS